MSIFAFQSSGGGAHEAFTFGRSFEIQGMREFRGAAFARSFD
jgi:hypothetical protein